MYILGISAFYHDSAAVLIHHGKIVAAAQEERFSRKKHDASFPAQAIAWCLEHAGVSAEQLSYVTFYDKPLLKFERILETYLGFAPKGFTSFVKAMPLWLKEKLFQKQVLIRELKALLPTWSAKERLLFNEHHLSHAASAFYPSPFDEALVLTMDGVGEWATASVALGKGSTLTILKEMHFPHSLGLLYSAFCYYLGFKVNSGEYKVMGLAPYGQPKYAQRIFEHLVSLHPDGTFRLNQAYFDYCTGLKMTNRRFSRLFNHPVRASEEEPLTDFHMDMAASVQNVTETIMLRMTQALAKEYQQPNLCMAGGVALNCVANGKILRGGAFKNIWIQPAAGDAGGALGAALSAWYTYCKKPRTLSGALKTRDAMQGTYLGPRFSTEEIAKRLERAQAVFETKTEDDMLKTTVVALAEGQAVGWFQGAMEFGPRALGGRSILGDPRSPTMQKLLNLKVKYRESFRPFAPSVLREDVDDWFDLNQDSPYMLLVAQVKKIRQRAMTESEQQKFGIDKLNVIRSEIPAITHVDYSARIQTVHKDTNPLYHRLISQFKTHTGCPVLINTSFNIRGEPIVCTPEDAFHCFMGSDIDLLVCGNCVLEKEKQPSHLRLNYQGHFSLD